MRAGLLFTAQSSAARSWAPRDAGWSKREFVSMPTTTKPCDASRGPSQSMLDQAAVKPGEIATAPKVPWLVSVG